MQWTNNQDLSQLNTFGLPVTAAKFKEVHSATDIIDCIQEGVFESKFLLLGGGSNVLFTNDYSGFVLLNKLEGRELIEENEDFVLLKIGSGENWHQTVLYCIEHNYCGIENLSLIPGSVGAAPIQNIGAYGVELKDVLHEVHYVDLTTGKELVVGNEDCQFGYRTSIFKTSLKGKVFITSVVLKLSKTPNLKLSYGAIESELAARNHTKIGIREVSDAVIAIRQSKLPDPKELGNSGSFFKNPVIPASTFAEIQKQHPEIPNYPAGENHIKLAAGWLIEQCGWKGKRVGETGSHAKQALVLVNYGNAKGNEIYHLAQDIIASVKKQFGVELEPEVNIIE